MTLKVQLNNDLKAAMRAKDTEKRNVLRLLLAAIKQSEVDSRSTLDDAGVLDVLTKQAKQRRESIADYTTAGRDDLAAGEEVELQIIKTYLPQMLSRDEIRELAEQTITAVGANSPKDMGQVMGRLMPQVKGKADGRVVNEVVRELLLN